MLAYEEVDLDICADMVVVERTVGDTSADDKYSALTKSDITLPKPHIYETINLSEMGDYVNIFNT